MPLWVERNQKIAVHLIGKGTRASFLIRDFTVYNAEDGKVISSDSYSTHAFDWFFPNGICEATMKQLSWIEEIPYEKAKMRSINQVVRQNVSQYDDQNKKIPERHCQKKWQFVRIEE